MTILQTPYTPATNLWEHVSDKAPKKILTCARSGLPLATITTLCSNGWPLLSHPTFNSMIHPVYGFPLDKLIVRFKDQLTVAHDTAFCLDNHELLELGLSMSAIMYSLDCFWLPATNAAYKQIPSLPCEAVIVGCGSRLLSLASWYHHATSKRLDFPLYRVSAVNANLTWDNFKTWLDDAFEIKQDWEEGRQELANDEIFRQRTASLQAVTAASMVKKIDFAKVWNWIDIQLAQDGRYELGRRETFKNLFMKGDTVPEDWTLDDVEDVQLAIVECCDIGNEINFFINNRLNNIKAVIADFYSSFTLLTQSVSDTCAVLDMTEEEHSKTTEFFKGFDKRVELLSDLPAAPKRESFASLGLFLRAQAQHNILTKRYDMAKAATATLPATVQAAPAPADKLDVVLTTTQTTAETL
jgi:hypothetical protein